MALLKKYVSVAEISVLTGFSIQFFYGEIYKARVFGSGIPFHKFGPRTIRFDPDEVFEWLRTRDKTFRSLNEAVEISKSTKVGK